MSDAPALPPALPGENTSLPTEAAGAVSLYRGGPADGAPVVLVHSVNAAASAYEMRPIYEGLVGRRAVHALDLPGFGRSERGRRPYTPRLMTDALHAVVRDVRARHDGAPVDAAALSLSCEFLARAANERPEAFRSLALISPTGLEGGKRRDGPEGSHLGKRWVHETVTCPLWDDLLFGLLTRPRVVRYFLRRTFGREAVDEGLWDYCVRSARQPGAKHAPFSFLSGYLFSGDATRLYERLEHPTWLSHGVRGDFVDYRGADALRERSHWRSSVFDTGALPHFEVPDAFVQEYEAFLAG
ncbi:MAG TPA: alpha/beta hydrolase [Sandaracinaceae bacterium LLY-WYZ-13_1]|nr:alpha/beta hydrolase [Sandaracinaceae bacterium LLY-WYZ-13_1]